MKPADSQFCSIFRHLRINRESDKQLADLVGTTQSVISRLEDSDYDGHSLSMLNRIAEALHKKLSVVMS